MEVTLLGMVIDVKAVQPKKALSPMIVSLLFSVKVTAFKPMQYKNALSPMEVTLAGIVIDVKT